MELTTKKQNNNYGYTKKSAIGGAFIGSLLVVESAKKVISINSNLHKVKSISDKRDYIKEFKGEASDEFIKNTVSKSIKNTKKYMKLRGIVGFSFALITATGLGFIADVIKNNFSNKKSQKVETPKVRPIKTQK